MRDDVTLERLSDDPYPIYKLLRREAPVAWVPDLQMWVVTCYSDVRDILTDTTTFVTGTDESLLFDTFGEHMLTTEGALHRRHRDAKTMSGFMPGAIRERLGDRIQDRIDRLIDEFADDGEAEIRQVFASRLPVLVMLDMFGLPESDEALFRSWYDSFEAALSNHARKESVRQQALADVESFHRYLQTHIDDVRTRPNKSLINEFLNASKVRRLTDAEIRRNSLIIFFGGISTVEALILNSIWSILKHESVFSRIRADSTLTDAAVEETMRWLSPVQSATRHVSSNTVIDGVRIPIRATVNCMLASANRDEKVFEKPDTFDIDRPNLSKHLGFAVGPHVCLGRHLAKEEARRAINTMVARLPEMTVVSKAGPVGHEFRQPKSLIVRWAT